MENLVTCLTQGHEKSAVVAAALVTLIGSYLTLRLGERARVNPPAQQWIWLCLSGLSGGMMIWCAHFISMLGYILPFPPSYDPVLTFLSRTSAVLTTTLASYIVLRSEGSLLVEAGGAIFGLGIALMHFIGMAGFNVPGTFVLVFALYCSFSFGRCAVRHSYHNDLRAPACSLQCGSFLPDVLCCCLHGSLC